MSKATIIQITAKHVPAQIKMECADLTVQQNFGPVWNEEYAYGKMDPIASFSHTSRAVSVNVVLVATNLKEAVQLQSNVDQFIKFQYPKYTGATDGGIGASLSSPPFFEVNVLNGKLYNTMQGYITEFNVTPGSTEDVAPLVSTYGNFFERKYIIEFAMTVLHDEVIGYVGDTEPGGDRGFVFTSAEATSRQAVARAQETVAAIRRFGAGIGNSAYSLYTAAVNAGVSPDAPVQAGVEVTTGKDE